MRKFAVLPLMFLGMNPGTGSAQPQVPSTITLRAGQGITQAMATVGCNVNWLAQVMDANNVAPQALHRLPLGTTYQLPFDCTKAPPNEVRLASETIMRGDAKDGADPFLAPTSETERFPAEQVLQEKIRALEAERESREHEIGVQRELAEKYRIELESTAPKLRNAEALPPPVPAAEPAQGMKWFVLALSVTAIGLAVAVFKLLSRLKEVHALYAQTERRRAELELDRDNQFAQRKKLQKDMDEMGRQRVVLLRNFVVFPHTIPIRRGGEEVSFAIAGIKKQLDEHVGCYHCPECSENTLYVRRDPANGYRTEGLARHLEKHRFVAVPDPDETLPLS